MKNILSSYSVQTLLVIIMGFCLGYVYITSTHSVYGMTYCQDINYSEDLTYSGYGSPFNFFTDTVTLAMQVLCFEDGAQLTVGTGSNEEYILDYAYQRIDGAWKKIQLVGDKKVGSWYIGSARALFEKDTLEEGETTQILAYVCQKIDGDWKCGCRDEFCETPYWQIQEFNFDTDATSIIGEEGSLEGGYLTTPTPSMGPVGTKVVLTGEGLSKNNNSVLFDGEVVAENLSSEDGKSVTFTVPNTVSYGYKRISLINDANDEIPGTSFIVTVPGAEKPIVNSISPEKGGSETEVTVYGEGFSKERNDVLVSFGVLRGVVSKDGTSLTFKLNALKDVMELEGISEVEGEMPIHVIVINGGGPSEDMVYTMEF